MSVSEVFIRNTNDLLDLVRIADGSGSIRYENAANTILSLCVLHLREHQLEIPPEAIPYYKALLEYREYLGYVTQPDS